MDPSQLANLPDSLKGTVEGFGIKMPSLGGESGGAGGAIGGLLNAIPGLGGSDSGSQPAPTPTATTTTTTTTQPAETQAAPTQPSGDGGLKDTLGGFLNPGTEQGQSEEPAVIKGLKGLFGGD
jgi:hypothetical protein